MKTRFALNAALVLAAAWPAAAAETQTYTYDAQGRLIQVARAGTVNNGVATAYTHDTRDNRLTKVTAGSGNPPENP